MWIWERASSREQGGERASEVAFEYLSGGGTFFYSFLALVGFDRFARVCACLLLPAGRRSIAVVVSCLLLF